LLNQISTLDFGLRQASTLCDISFLQLWKSRDWSFNFNIV
jgi:hypothetical protein